MFLHKLNLELQGKTALTYETHTAESDMTTNVWTTRSHIARAIKVQTKEVSVLVQICVRHTFWAQAAGPRVIQTSVQEQKRLPCFKVTLRSGSSNLPLEVAGNSMTCHAQRQTWREEPNTTNTFLPSSKHAQLKACACRPTAAFGSTYQKRHSQKWTNVKFHHRPVLTDEQLQSILTIKNTNSEPQWGKILSPQKELHSSH